MPPQLSFKKVMARIQTVIDDIAPRSIIATGARPFFPPLPDIDDRNKNA